jgi:hypothetical protein
MSFSSVVVTIKFRTARLFKSSGIGTSGLIYHLAESLNYSFKPLLNDRELDLSIGLSRDDHRDREVESNRERYRNVCA